jgi:hypothetical protein
MWNKTKWSNIAERHIEIYHELLLHRDNEVYKGL